MPVWFSLVIAWMNFSWLKNLEVLDLGYNTFDNAASILSCLDGLSSLKSLSLAGIQWKSSFGGPFHAKSTKKFQTILETISSKLLHLEVLDLSSNNLSTEILPSLRAFGSLKELYLNNTELDSDLHFQGLKNLEILDISGNINFRDIDIASALSGLSSLKSLNLGSSGITPRSIHNMSKLRSLEMLYLDGNNLDIWPLENHGFAWPSSLQVLVLSENNLSSKNIISSLNGLPSLKSLDLSGNSFGNNIISSLNGLPHLKSLDLSGTNLKGSLDISGLLTLTSLESLDLSGNNIVNFIVHKEYTILGTKPSQEFSSLETKPFQEFSPLGTKPSQEFHLETLLKIYGATSMLAFSGSSSAIEITAYLASMPTNARTLSSHTLHPCQPMPMCHLNNFKLL
ncbi:receptor protein [Trifolium repens]|nr:receptor protein [Trifolium repens]